jgi:putative tributyrin esterase
MVKSGLPGAVERRGIRLIMLLATFHAVEFAVDKPHEEPLMFKCSIRHAAVYGLCFEALVAHLTHGQSVKTVEMQANSVGRTLSYVVALPMEYSQSSQRYPVLYMLHGFSSNYTQWFRLEAHKCAKDYPLILVMPDAGNSWYINWARSEGNQKNAWEDYIVEDLVEHVDATYRTIPAREGRAICGLSMGGFGAMVLALRHPDKFCSVGSQSGALNYARNCAESLARGESLAPREAPSPAPSSQVTTVGFSSQAERTPRGDPFVTADDCARYDPYRLVHQVARDRLPHIYLDCGTEDGWLPNTREFLDVLLKNNIPCTYTQSPGEHRGAYWSREVDMAIGVQFIILQRHPATREKTDKPILTR